MLEARRDAAASPECALDLRPAGAVVVRDSPGRRLDGVVVLDVVVGRDVERGRDAEEGIEAAVHRPVGQHVGGPHIGLAFPAGGIAEAQVPLAHHRRSVAGRPEDRRNGCLAIAQPVALRAEGVSAGHQAVAARHAEADRGVGVGEADALVGQAVYVGRRAFRLRIEAPRVAVAHVVGEEEDDVGLACGGLCGGGPSRGCPSRRAGAQRLEKTASAHALRRSGWAHHLAFCSGEGRAAVSRWRTVLSARGMARPKAQPMAAARRSHGNQRVPRSLPRTHPAT